MSVTLDKYAWLPILVVLVVTPIVGVVMAMRSARNAELAEMRKLAENLEAVGRGIQEYMTEDDMFPLLDAEELSSILAPATQPATAPADVLETPTTRRDSLLPTDP